MLSRLKSQSMEYSCACSVIREKQREQIEKRVFSKNVRNVRSSHSSHQVLLDLEGNKLVGLQSRAVNLTGTMKQRKLLNSVVRDKPYSQ